MNPLTFYDEDRTGHATSVTPPIESSKRSIQKNHSGLSGRKNNRGKIEIMGDILLNSTAGTIKTHVMFYANLSHGQTVDYLALLEKKNLIMKDIQNDGSTVYRTTERGRLFLDYFSRMVELMEPDENSVHRRYAINSASTAPDTMDLNSS